MTPQELLKAPIDGDGCLDDWLDLIESDGHFGGEYDTLEKWQQRKVEIAKRLIDLIEGKK